MQDKPFRLFISAAMLLSSVAVAPLPAQQQAGPADGITMDMMPITPEQIAQCRSQASSQLASEQETLNKREHQQDKDKMKQGVVTGATGAATSALSRGRGLWGWHNNNGAHTADATGATQRTERNSDNVASTTAIGQQVGSDAYNQCIAGIKGPEYVHFRQTGKIEAFTGSAPAASVATPAAAVSAPVVSPHASPVQDEGDGKHFILTAPGQTDAREVVRAPGSGNAYIEEATGDKYIVMPNGSVTRIPNHSAVKKTANKS